ncbi:ABC-type transport system involved in cytochrome bd biosynthesis fused ATPase/permease subunit [Deinococcus metalli]|uniref:ABC-type transport system involved in cytochrome bd biosynthesis fused ATPase/permease subunit n=1 Tax=Deinococcus metalli TaxID=1141878 RepID=A0A7W8KEE8_9DEIO|nr:ATP-binding cassette domain-containing protein [Deinococcus metalli]MBB5376659.1 ABC-type transport system involved in cytochrome bd biosynthesis fused ATPase/permease subunit [Deinococcus metalli]
MSRHPALSVRAQVMDVPGLRARLVLTAVWSAVGLGATVGAYVVLARVIAGTLLHGIPGVSVPDAGWPDLGWIAALLGLRAVASAARERLGVRLAARALRTWRGRLTSRALDLGPVALADLHGADLATLDSELGPRLTPYYARYLPGALHAGLAFAVTLGAALWLDPSTALLLLVTGPLALGFLVLVGLATNAASAQQWHAHTRLSARLLTLTRALPTLHAYGAVAPYRAVLSDSALRHREATMRVLRIAFLNGFVLDFAATMATALVAVWIGVRLFAGEAALAPTLAALMLVPEFFGPLRQLGADRHAALDAQPLLAQLGALLARPLAPTGAVRVPPGVPEIRLHAAHARLTTPMAPLSVTVAPGALVALRGPSGSGKTTLLHALHKHVPHDGVIEVGGVPLDALDRTAWQARVAFVPQHPRLMATTLRENLRAAQPDADDAALGRALAAVGLARLPAQLPLGLDTPLGEGGTGLSGGETARVALARALLAGADVILLDEVTAHLDADSEAAVLEVVRRAFAGRSVLMATHRAVPAGWREARLEAGA